MPTQARCIVYNFVSCFLWTGLSTQFDMRHEWVWKSPRFSLTKSTPEQKLPISLSPPLSKHLPSHQVHPCANTSHLTKSTAEQALLISFFFGNTRARNGHFSTICHLLTHLNYFPIGLWMMSNTTECLHVVCVCVRACVWPVCFSCKCCASFMAKQADVRWHTLLSALCPSWYMPKD